MNKSQNKNVFRLFHSRKRHLLALLGLLQTELTDPLSYNSISEIPTLSYTVSTWGLKNVPHLGGASLYTCIGHY